MYLHGFSATLEEIRPVPDLVAEALGANIVYPWLTGHGRDGAALGRARAGDWLDDTAEALAVARGIGRRVLVMGTSTGGTLAAYAAGEPDMVARVAGIAMIAPNFGIAAPAARILGWPGARIWGPWIAGTERCFEPVTPAHTRFCTECYPTEAVVPVGALVAEVARRDLGAVTLPVLAIYAPADTVVDVAATEAALARWGGPVETWSADLPAGGVDPVAHAITGDILSPAMTDAVAARIAGWAAGL